MWVCVENEKYQHPIWGRLRYIVSTAALIDFLAIFPFYFSLFATDLAIVRILRLFRIFRLLRITRYSHAFRLIQNVVADKKEELVLSTILVIFMLIIVSSIMYYVEHAAQKAIAANAAHIAGGRFKITYTSLALSLLRGIAPGVGKPRATQSWIRLRRFDLLVH